MTAVQSTGGAIEITNSRTAESDDKILADLANATLAVLAHEYDSSEPWPVWAARTLARELGGEAFFDPAEPEVHVEEDDGGQLTLFPAMKDLGASPCGANTPGGGGFQPGNDCAGGSEDEESSTSGGSGSSEGEPDPQSPSQWADSYAAYRQSQADAIEDGVVNILADADQAFTDAIQDKQIPSKQLLEYRETLQEALGDLSPRMLQIARENIRDFEFYGDVIDVTDMAASMTGTTLEAMLEKRQITAAFYVGGAGQQLHLNGGLDTMFAGAPDRKGIYIHELAHAFDDGFSGSDEWGSAWSSEIDRDDAPLSKYARTNPEEGFAEFMRLAVQEPVYARQKYPESWAAVSRKYEMEPAK